MSREIGNIGLEVCNCTIWITGTPVDISVPSVRCLDFVQTIEFMGGAEEHNRTLLKFSGEIGTYNAM